METPHPSTEAEAGTPLRKHTNGERNLLSISDSSLDIPTGDIGELFGELQAMLTEALPQEPDHQRPLGMVPVGGTRWRGVQSRYQSPSSGLSPCTSLEPTSSQEVAELEAALKQSSAALRTSQLQLQALSGRVEELQSQLEAECRAMLEAMQAECDAAKVAHARDVTELQERLRQQKAEADREAESVREAAKAAVAEAAAVAAEAAAAAARQEDLQQQRDELSVRVSELEKQLAWLQTTMASVEQQREGLAARVEHLESQLALVVAERNALMQRMEQAEVEAAERVEAQAEAARMCGRLFRDVERAVEAAEAGHVAESLREELQRTEKQLAVVVAERDALTQRVAGVEAEAADSLAAARSEAAEQRAALSAQLKAAEVAREELGGQLVEERAEKVALAEALSTARSEMEARPAAEWDRLVGRMERHRAAFTQLQEVLLSSFPSTEATTSSTQDTHANGSSISPTISALMTAWSTPRTSAAGAQDDDGADTLDFNRTTTQLLAAARALQSAIREQRSIATAAMAVTTARDADAVQWRAAALAAAADTAASKVAMEELRNAAVVALTAGAEDGVSLSAELELRQTQVTELTATATELSTQVLQLRTELASMAESNAALQSELLAAGAAQAALRATVERAAAEATATRICGQVFRTVERAVTAEEAVAVGLAIKGLREEVQHVRADAQKQLAVVVAERDALANRMAVVEAEAAEALSAARSEAADEQTKAQVQLQRLREEAVEAEAVRKGLEAQVVEAAEALSAARSEAAAEQAKAQVQLQRLREKAVEAEAVRKGLETQVAEAAEALSAARKEATAEQAEAQEQLQCLREEAAEAKAVRKGLEGQVAEAEAAQKGLEAQLAVIEAARRGLEAQVAEVEATRRGLEMQVAEAAAEWAEAQDQLQRLRAEMAETEAALLVTNDEAAAERAKAQNELHRLRMEVAEAETVRKGLETQVSELHEDLRRVRAAEAEQKACRLDDAAAHAQELAEARRRTDELAVRAFCDRVLHRMVLNGIGEHLRTSEVRHEAVLAEARDEARRAAEDLDEAKARLSEVDAALRSAAEQLAEARRACSEAIVRPSEVQVEADRLAADLRVAKEENAKLLSDLESSEANHQEMVAEIADLRVRPSGARTAVIEGPLESQSSADIAVEESVLENPQAHEISLSLSDASAKTVVSELIERLTAASQHPQPKQPHLPTADAAQSTVSVLSQHQQHLEALEAAIRHQHHQELRNQRQVFDRQLSEAQAAVERLREELATQQGLHEAHVEALRSMWEAERRELRRQLACNIALEAAVAGPRGLLSLPQSPARSPRSGTASGIAMVMGAGGSERSSPAGGPSGRSTCRTVERSHGQLRMRIHGDGGAGGGGGSGAVTEGPAWRLGDFSGVNGNISALVSRSHAEVESPLVGEAVDHADVTATMRMTGTAVTAAATAAVTAEVGQGNNNTFGDRDDGKGAAAASGPQVSELAATIEALRAQLAVYQLAEKAHLVSVSSGGGGSRGGAPPTRGVLQGTYETGDESPASPGAYAVVMTRQRTNTSTTTTKTFVEDDNAIQGVQMFIPEMAYGAPDVRCLPSTFNGGSGQSLKVDQPSRDDPEASSLVVKLLVQRAMRRAERAALVTELEAVRRAAAAAAANAAAHATANASLRRRLTALLTSYNCVSGELDVLRVAHAELRVEIGPARHTAERLQYDNAVLRRQLDGVRRGSEALFAAIEAVAVADATAKEVRQRFTAADVEAEHQPVLAALHSRVDGLAAELATAEEKVAALEAERERLTVALLWGGRTGLEDPLSPCSAIQLRVSQSARHSARLRQTSSVPPSPSPFSSSLERLFPASARPCRQQGQLVHNHSAPLQQDYEQQLLQQLSQRGCQLAALQASTAEVLRLAQALRGPLGLDGLMDIDSLMLEMNQAGTAGQNHRRTLSAADLLFAHDQDRNLAAAAPYGPHVTPAGSDAAAALEGAAAAVGLKSASASGAYRTTVCNVDGERNVAVPKMLFEQLLAAAAAAAATAAQAGDEYVMCTTRMPACTTAEDAELGADCDVNVGEGGSGGGGEGHVEDDAVISEAGSEDVQLYFNPVYTDNGGQTGSGSGSGNEAGAGSGGEGGGGSGGVGVCHGHDAHDDDDGPILRPWVSAHEPSNPRHRTLPSASLMLPPVNSDPNHRVGGAMWKSYDSLPYHTAARTVAGLRTQSSEAGRLGGSMGRFAGPARWSYGPGMAAALRWRQLRGRGRTTGSGGGGGGLGVGMGGGPSGSGAGIIGGIDEDVADNRSCADTEYTFDEYRNLVPVTKRNSLRRLYRRISRLVKD